MHTTTWYASVNDTINVAAIQGAINDSTKLPLAGGQLTGQLRFKTPNSVAADTSLNLSTYSNILTITATGTEVVNAISGNDGAVMFVTFGGVCQLVNSANLVCPTGGNILTALNDSCILVFNAGVCSIQLYTRFDGTALTASSTVTENALFNTFVYS